MSQSLFRCRAALYCFTTCCRCACHSCSEKTEVSMQNATLTINQRSKYDSLRKSWWLNGSEARCFAWTFNKPSPNRWTTKAWRKCVLHRVFLDFLHAICLRQCHGPANGWGTHQGHVDFLFHNGLSCWPDYRPSSDFIQTTFSWNATPPTGATESTPVRLFTPIPPI